MTNTRLFQGKEYSLTVYNAQALINQAFYFYTVIDCEDVPFEKIDYSFDGFVSGYFRIYNERWGRLIKEFSMTQYGPYLYVNASVSDMTFEDNGDYYYEIGYSDGYEKALRYGKLHVI